MDWKYVKPIKSLDLISEFENEFCYIFPDEYKQCVSQYNGGRPSKRIFDTSSSKEFEMKSLLSFNHYDRETIWSVNQRDDEFLTSYIAFATDSSGNLICFNRKDNSIIFVNDETNSVDMIASDFSSFLDSLYSE